MLFFAVRTTKKHVQMQPKTDFVLGVFLCHTERQYTVDLIDVPESQEKKKIISTSVSLLYVHHCNTTGNPSASEYSACHQSTPTAEWEPHASIYLMPSCDGWPHLLEIQTWESPSNHNVWCCQHFPLWSVLLLLDSVWFTLLGVL